MNNMASYIEQLPSHVCDKLASELDGASKPNWKSLITKMPKGVYNAKDILKFHMAVLQPNGSPTLQLLADMSRKRTTIAELVMWIKSLVSFPHLVDLLENVEVSSLCIVTQPRSKTISCGENVSVQLIVEGSPPLRYQWFKGIVQLNDQTECILSVSNARLEDSGYYTCRVSNNIGYVFSNWINLNVIRTPLPSQLFNDAVPTELPRPTRYDLNSESADTVDSFPVAVGGVQSTSLSCDHAMKEHLCLKLSNPRGRNVSSRSPVVSLPEPAAPTQKIALIIGNQNYVHENKLGILHQPMNDAHDLASALVSIDFKVVSLVNLTLNAMNDALTYFYNLLDAGTYALFYFAGHGFENDHDSYLVPVDATDLKTNECFPVSDVLHALTKRAVLSVLLVDSCRTNPCVCLEDPIPKLWKHEDTGPLKVERKNVIIGYSCCSNGRAMESQLMRNGFFATFLLENITKDIKIDDVLFEVSNAMYKHHVVDPETGKTQIVYRMSTVAEDLRLTDACVNNTEISQQTVLWQQANIAPDSPVIILENEFITVKLVFSAEFSNSLRIQSIITNANTSFCGARFILPTNIGGSAVEVVTTDATEKDGGTRYARICNLERLEGNIDIYLHVTYDANGILQHQTVFYSIKEKPLYAKIATEIAANGR